MIREAVLYFTRRCPVACRYCRIPRYKKRELSTEEMKRAISIIYERVQPEILVIFGGEPTLREDFVELIEFINENYSPGDRVTYTVITSSITPFDEKLKCLKSLTCSIDVLPGKLPTKSGDIRKSILGFDYLMRAREVGIPDVTGNIIIHRENCYYVPELIRTLSEHKIWSIVGVVHNGKEDFWRFRSEEDMMLTPEQAKWISWELVKLKRDPNILLHNNMVYLMGIEVFGHNPTWHCHELQYLVVDCDGSLIVCHDWWGKEIPKLSIFDYGIKYTEEQLKELWIQDTKDCPGCWYTHQINAEYGGLVNHYERPRGSYF